MAGADGAGKTTLMRLLAGLLLPTRGNIAISGYSTINHAKEIHQKIGYMPQRFGLYEDLTVLQNLSLFADLQAFPKEQKMERFDQLLAMTQLKPFSGRLARDLSGGMKQKLGLCCALIHTPPLLLLDEPTVGIDPLSRRELWKMILQLQDQGITIIWSTSYLDEAAKTDFAILLHEGKILYQGPPRELTRQVEGKVFRIEKIEGSKRKFLSDLLAQNRILDGVVRGQTIRVICNEANRDPNWIPCPPSFEDAAFFITPKTKKLEYAPALSPMLSNTNITSKIINAENLTKKFGAFTAVSQISFHVQTGEIFGLLGPNGAGKSTTFKMLCGLERPTEGKAEVNGINMQLAPSQARSKMGYMAQKFSLYNDLTVGQNLKFFSSVYTNAIRKNAIDQIVSRFHLEEFLCISTRDIPSGCKQRLALACAVMHKPMALFLDEPTSGVDPASRRNFWNYMKELAEQGCAILVSTHSMEEAEYCDRIGLVHQSRLIHIGTPEALKELAHATTLEDAFITLIEQQNALG